MIYFMYEYFYIISLELTILFCFTLFNIIKYINCGNERVVFVSKKTHFNHCKGTLCLEKLCL